MQVRPKLLIIGTVFVLSSSGIGYSQVNAIHNAIGEMVWKFFKATHIDPMVRAMQNKQQQQDKNNKAPENVNYYLDKNNAMASFYREASNDIVINNDSDSDWTFGFMKDLGNSKDELGGSPSGKVAMQGATFKDNGTFSLGRTVTIDNTTTSGITIPAKGTVVITPVFDRKNFIQQKFAQLCFLQDTTGKRLYLTIKKETGTDSTASIRQAKISENDAIRGLKLEFNTIELFHMSLISIQGNSVVAK